ncbi:Gfo/Idh/MocA family protein [Cohnella cellulosilytica]|uniref:Gfo/Idh/MocA family protein n=1 Tax=Cohnella cellulosilytica TaxID=986710 RepID=A0ABW2FDZ3_9BACL
MVNIVIVGAGAISRAHISALRQIANANVVGVVDVNLENAQAAAEMCGATAYGKLDDCLDQAEMVFVLTPPSTHKDIAVQAMRAGKHVVVEKPITASVEDAEIMVEVAQECGVKLMVGFNMRFRTGFKRLREITASGKLGQPLTYWCQRMGMRVDPNNKWSTDPLLMTGMSIQSLSHDIDMMRWVAGEVNDVKAHVLESRPQLPGFDDFANAVFTLANGGTAVFQASWTSHLEMNSRGVIGTKGTAYIRGASLWNIDSFHWKTEDMEYEQSETLNDIHDVRSFLAEDTYFIDCVENDIEPTITGVDGLKALKVSYGILASSRDNAVVRLDY